MASVNKSKALEIPPIKISNTLNFSSKGIIIPIKNIKGLALMASPIPLKPILILSKSKFLNP